MKNIFKTSDLNFAAYLVQNDFELVGVDRTTDRKRAFFLFQETSRVHEIAESYKRDNTIRGFIYAQKEVKNRLYADY